MRANCSHDAMRDSLSAKRLSNVLTVVEESQLGSSREKLKLDLKNNEHERVSTTKSTRPTTVSVLFNRVGNGTNNASPKKEVSKNNKITGL